VTDCGFAACCHDAVQVLLWLRGELGCVEADGNAQAQHEHQWQTWKDILDTLRQDQMLPVFSWSHEHLQLVWSREEYEAAVLKGRGVVPLLAQNEHAHLQYMTQEC
jgi:hypothetical protein